MAHAAALPRRPHSPLILAMLTAVGIALFLGFVALGAWQVQRLSWKLDLIERVDQRLKAAPTIVSCCTKQCSPQGVNCTPTS